MHRVAASMAAAMAAGSARKSAASGVRTVSRPRKCAALSKAGWALKASTIFGLPGAPPLPRRAAAARSRAAFTARKMLSVPPVVMAPRASGPPCSSDRPIATTSRFELRQAAEGAQAEAVLREVHLVGALGDVEHVVAGEMDEGRRPAGPPVDVVRLGSIELRLQLGPWRARLRQCNSFRGHRQPSFPPQCTTRFSTARASRSST